MVLVCIKEPPTPHCFLMTTTFGLNEPVQCPAPPPLTQLQIYSSEPPWGTNMHKDGRYIDEEQIRNCLDTMQQYSILLHSTIIQFVCLWLTIIWIGLVTLLIQKLYMKWKKGPSFYRQTLYFSNSWKYSLEGRCFDNTLL